jgi:tetratricopeptide (TPR) repeat protein
MIVWAAELKEIEKLYESLNDRFPELEKELGQLIRFDDPNVIMLYSRRCLEVIITDLCEIELKRPRRTEPLKGIIDKLNKEEKVPSHIITSMDHLNGLATYGAHPKDFDPEQVKPVLNNLSTVLKWYLKYKDSLTIGKIKVEEEKTHIREPLEEIKKEDGWKEQVKPAKFTSQKLLSGIFITTILLVVIAIYAYPKLFKRNTLDNLRSSDGRISVAVMPLQNMTNDTVWNIWQDGIQNELITSLTNSEELKVRQTESINNLIQSKGLTNYASITPSIASNISQKLDASVFIYGSIKQVGKTIRVNVQLIDSKTEEAFKSFQIDGIADNILHITDSLSNQIKNFLIISKLEKELPLYIQPLPLTTSSEAYRYYLYGEDARRNRDFPTARNMYSQALAIDSNFTLVTLKLSTACGNQGLYEEAREWLLKAYKKREQAPLRLKILINKHYAFFFETPYEEIKCLRQLLEIDDIFPGNYYDIGLKYNILFEYDKAISEFEKSLEIYDKFDCKPWWVYNYSLLGEAYHKTGQYKKEKKLYKKADQDFPENPLIIYQKALLSLTEGDTVAANNYLEKYVSVSKEDPSSEEFVTIGPAEFYTEAGNLEKAEEFLRQELSLAPDNAYRIYKLAWFLIDKDRNIEEGMELIEKALGLRPDLKWYLLDCKGWGLYKQGKYEKALKILEEGWDLRVYYQHPIYLHLEEVKKAVANQKKN